MNALKSLLKTLAITAALGSVSFSAQAKMLGYATNALGIYRIDTGTATATQLYSGAPFGNSSVPVAAAAQRATDGLLFFIVDGDSDGNGSAADGNGQVFTWDPATPAVAPIQIGTTGATTPYLLRMAFHLVTGQLVTMNSLGTGLYTLNQTTGASTGSVAITGWPGSTSGDIAFEPGTNKLFAATYFDGTNDGIVNGNHRLYELPLAGGAAVQVGLLTGISLGTSPNQSITSKMTDSAGSLFVSGADVVGGVSGNLYSIPTGGGAATLVGSMGVTVQDFASASAPSPTVGKFFAAPTTAINSDVTMTIVLNNTFGYPLTGTTMDDNFPTGMLLAPVPNATNTCGGSLQANPNGTLLRLTGGTIPANNSCTITAQIRITSLGVKTNTVLVGGVQTSLAYNDVPASASITGVTSLSGTVFEDVNYGGGAGRPLSTATTVVVPNARVELYDAAGAFVAATTSNASGGYTFNGLSAATYSVRVVNSTVRSTRVGGSTCTSCVPIQTFVTNGLSGTVAIGDTARVGGEDPALVDAGSNTSNATLASLSTASTVAQSVTQVTLTKDPVTGVDFGYNFDTIVSTRNSGQGSLAQFITNSNALGGETSLVQAGSRIFGVDGSTQGLPSGRETSIFMIPDGNTDPGLRSGLSSPLNGGVAVISLSNLLPPITGTSTIIDGGTQTFNIGNSNAGTIGMSGNTGTDALAWSAIEKPEVQIQDAGGLGLGLDIQQSSIIVRNISILGFGNSATNGADANIRVANNFTGTVIQANVLGATASSFSDPGASLRTGGANLLSAGGDTGSVLNNVIGFAAGDGISLAVSSSGWTITSNEIRGNGIGGNGDGVNVVGGSGTATLQRNVLAGNGGFGFDSLGGAGSDVLRNNTITNNGLGGTETAGVRLGSSNNMAQKNVINANVGAGLSVTSSAATNLITINSFFDNGTASPLTNQIGIDLLSAADNQASGSSGFVTLNDSGDSDTGGNGLANYPILATAIISGGNLVIAGYARPGALIEFFIAAADPSGFGEGKTYLFTTTEGCTAVNGGCAAVDTDTGTGTYGPGAINGKAQGTDTTNRFTFSIPVPAGISMGSTLTATATIGNTTSEFSGITSVFSPTAVTVAKTSAVIQDPFNLTTNPKRVPGAIIEYSITVTNTNATAAAENVIITDAIPTNTTYRASTIRVLNTGTEDDDALGADETDPNGGDFGVTAANTVTIRIGSIPASGSATGVFRVTVN